MKSHLLCWPLWKLPKNLLIKCDVNAFVHFVEIFSHESASLISLLSFIDVFLHSHSSLSIILRIYTALLLLIYCVLPLHIIAILFFTVLLAIISYFGLYPLYINMLFIGFNFIVSLGRQQSRAKISEKCCYLPENGIFLSSSFTFNRRFKATKQPNAQSDNWPSNECGLKHFWKFLIHFATLPFEHVSSGLLAMSTLHAIFKGRTFNSNFLFLTTFEHFDIAIITSIFFLACPKMR